jgi:hypothetical protein
MREGQWGRYLDSAIPYKKDDHNQSSPHLRQVEMFKEAPSVTFSGFFIFQPLGILFRKVVWKIVLRVTL